MFDANNISEISYARLSGFDALRLALKLVHQTPVHSKTEIRSCAMI